MQFVFFVSLSVMSALLIIVAIYQATRKSKDPDTAVPLATLTFFGLALIVATSITFGNNQTAGRPAIFIKPGKYEILKKVNREFNVYTQTPSTNFVLRNEDKEIRLYAIPTDKLKGSEKEGETIVISETLPTIQVSFGK